MLRDTLVDHPPSPIFLCDNVSTPLSVTWHFFSGHLRLLWGNFVQKTYKNVMWHFGWPPALYHLLFVALLRPPKVWLDIFLFTIIIALYVFWDKILFKKPSKNVMWHFGWPPALFHLLFVALLRPPKVWLDIFLFTIIIAVYVFWDKILLKKPSKNVTWHFGWPPALFHLLFVTMLRPPKVWRDIFLFFLAI